MGAVSVAITFDPHPLSVLAPQKSPKLLTLQPVKLELLADSGIDRLLVLPFTRDFSLWPPEKFVEEALGKAVRAVAVIVGDNFRFGYGAAGDANLLAELGKQWNFETQVLPAVHIRGRPVSSSQIRSLLKQGDVSRANRLLGRPFSVRQSIESGLGIGRSQTVPTLNLAPYTGLLPATGVYVTQTRISKHGGQGDRRARAQIATKRPRQTQRRRPCCFLSPTSATAPPLSNVLSASKPTCWSPGPAPHRRASKWAFSFASATSASSTHPNNSSLKLSMIYNERTCIFGDCHAFESTSRLAERVREVRPERIPQPPFTVFQQGRRRSAASPPQCSTR